MPDLPTLLDEHVVLKYECLDRLFLNGYLPRLQTPEQLASFLCQHRGEEIPRYDLLGELTSNFMTAVDQLAADRDIPVVHFERGQRKEEIAAPYFAAAEREGVVLIGIAQEKANVFRPCGRRQREKGTYSVTRAAAYVNHVYFSIWDADWGPSFIKVCTYAPWSIRVYFDRWLYRLPSPLAPKDRRAGYVHALSILQRRSAARGGRARPPARRRRPASRTVERRWAMTSEVRRRRRGEPQVGIIHQGAVEGHRLLARFPPP